MPDKKFLEEYPLYKKKKIELISCNNGFYAWYKIPSPSINYQCPNCGSSQTYNITEEFDEEQSVEKIIATNYHVQYKCDGCRESKIEYFINLSMPDNSDYHKVFVQKIGQFPAWSIKTDNTIDKMLGEYKDLYKKGLICQSQSYGIGSYAYFRRIAENIIDKLLYLIPNLIESNEDKIKFSEALNEVKKTHVTEKKIELIKDLLPLSLRPNNINPLKILHSALSNGIHNKTDEECMERAEEIKNVLTFLTNQIIKAEEDKRTFTENMKKLLKNNN